MLGDLLLSSDPLPPHSMLEPACFRVQGANYPFGIQMQPFELEGDPWATDQLTIAGQHYDPLTFTSVNDPIISDGRPPGAVGEYMTFVAWIAWQDNTGAWQYYGGYQPKTALLVLRRWDPGSPGSPYSQVWRLESSNSGAVFWSPISAGAGGGNAGLGGDNVTTFFAVGERLYYVGVQYQWWAEEADGSFGPEQHQGGDWTGWIPFAASDANCHAIL